MATDVSGVFISHERLKALEKLEESLPELLSKTAEEAIKRHTKSKLDALHAKEKENPKEKSASVLANYYKNKDEINAKRREKYAAKKTIVQNEAKNEIE